MSSYLRKLRLSKRSSQQSNGSSSLSYSDTDGKTAGDSTLKYDTDRKWPLNEEPEADKIIAPGELSFEESTSGGLGRHLGLFSTTFLM
jgi:hypothetical protein